MKKILDTSDSVIEAKVLTGRAVSFGSGYAQGRVLKDARGKDAPDNFVLVLENGSAEDADAFAFRANAIITRNGGALSHLAVLARELGTLYVTGVDIDRMGEGSHVKINADMKSGTGTIKVRDEAQTTTSKIQDVLRGDDAKED